MDLPPGYDRDARYPILFGFHGAVFHDWNRFLTDGDFAACCVCSPAEFHLENVRDLAGFYRRLWAQGEAGVEVPLTVEENGARRVVTVKTMNRYDYLKLDTTY